MWSGHWHWLLLLLTATTAFACFAALQARAQGRIAMQNLTPRLARPGYWRRIKHDYAPAADARWKQLLVSAGLTPTGAPATVLLTPCAPDLNFVEPEAFLNAYACSAVLIPTGYDRPLRELNAIYRFAVYHELAHATSVGTLLWSSRYLKPASYGTAILLTILFSQSLALWAHNLCAPVLAILLLGCISPLHRKIAAEVHADSQAAYWLQQDSVADAVAVCNNRVRVWSGACDFVFDHRVRNMKDWNRYLTRVREGRWAYRPPIESHANNAWWLEYPTALTLVIGMHGVTEAALPIVHLGIAFSVAAIAHTIILWRRHRDADSALNRAVIDALPPEDL